MKSVVASLIVIAAVFGLVLPVQAIGSVYGTVYNPDGTPAEGVEVTVTNLNTGFSATTITNPSGFYTITPGVVNGGDQLKIVATKGDLYATKTVTYLQGPFEVNLTLQTVAAPAFTPIGLIALVSLLATIFALSIRRKRR